MTDITTIPALSSPVTRARFFGLKLPKLGLGVFLADALVTIAEAFQLAYVAPYDSRSASRPSEHEI
jgi:hypothetical protein